MQCVGGERLALRGMRSAMQRTRAPEIDGDVDQEDDKRDGGDRGRRGSLAQAAGAMPPTRWFADQLAALEQPAHAPSGTS